MWKNKVRSFLGQLLNLIKRNAREIFFGLYLMAVLSISVAASAQNGVQYGTMMFFTLVLVSVCLIVPKMSAKIRSVNCEVFVPEKKGVIRFMCVFSLVCFAFFLFWFIAYFPGAFSPDSINQYGQAVQGRYNDWHPALHTLFAFTLPLKLTGISASIVLFQIVCFALVLGVVATTVYRFCGKKWAIALMLPVVISPWTYNIAMHPWKDVSFALAAALCMAVAIQIYCRKDVSIRKMVLFVVLLTFATVFRHNGILFTGMLVFALFFQMPVKRWLILLGLFVAAIGFVRGPLYTVLDVEKPGNRVVETMGFPLSVVMYVAKECPECLNDETSEFVDLLTRAEPNWKSNYDLTGFPSIKYGKIDLAVIEDAGRLKILRMMAKCVLTDPVHSAIAVVAMTSIVYGLEINCDHEIERMPNEYKIGYGGNAALKKIADNYSMVVRKTPIRFIIATIGMPILVMLAFILFRTRPSKDDYKRVLLCLPIFTYDFGTMLVMSGAESRFFYVTMLVCPLVVSVMLRKPVPDVPEEKNGALSENSN